MTGWHYTSWRNWEKIKKQGMIPYPIDKPELKEYFDQVPLGIWVWEQEPSNESELGSIIFQLSTKAQTKIVKLLIEYEDEDLLYFSGNGHPQKIHLLHDGNIAGPNSIGWDYHRNQEAVVVIKRIPPEKIKLVKTYDLMDIVREKK